MEITFHDIEVCDEDGNDRVADIRVKIEDNGIFYITNIRETNRCECESCIPILRQEEDGIRSHVLSLFKRLSRLT